jgi:hypothetical protein
MRRLLQLAPADSRAYCAESVQISWQVPLEGPLLRGGLAAVLKTHEDAWHGRQETGEPRSDFFLPTRQVL